MIPDNVLDTAVEDFYAVVGISTWEVGTYNLYPYGWDIQNDYNSTSDEHASVTIYDDLPPMIWDARVDGMELYETNNIDAGLVTLTGQVDDTITGISLCAINKDIHFFKKGPGRLRGKTPYIAGCNQGPT